MEVQLGATPSGTTDAVTKGYVDTAIAAKPGATIPTAVKTANYTAVVGDFAVMDATSGALVVTLPTTPADNSIIGIKRNDTVIANTVTVNCGGSDVFNKSGGSTSQTIPFSNYAVTFMYVAGIWYQLNTAIPIGQLDSRYLLLGGTDLTVADGGTGVSTLTGIVKGNGTSAFSAATAGTDYAGVGSTSQTLSATRINPRINTITSSATPAVNVDTTDQFNITALAVAITSMTSGLTGTPVDGQRLMFRITGTASRAITWGTSFVPSGQTSPLSTTSSTNTHMVFFIYDSVKAKWVCMSVDGLGYA